MKRWWDSLTESDRREASVLWDQRREQQFFDPQHHADGTLDTPEQVPTVIGGRFIPHDDSVRMHEWIEDWHVYLFGHYESRVLESVVILHTIGGVCQAHPAAQAVTAAGVLPADFRCPLDPAVCPMHRLQKFAPNEAIFLAPSSSGGWWVVTPQRRRSKPSTT
ncbi:hypothetical protein [Limnoglobus roseus]|uniref:hypothetical protein n=1 Tax=Limnoglobus roseus TaxID=2598579 RepID=UPI0011EB502D|nr:hypothetical protein [Limnoglobus roseus]